MLRAHLAAMLVLATLPGCADVEAPAYERHPMSFADEQVIAVPLARAATVTYLVVATDDITTFDSCLLRADGLDAWRDDRGRGISCDVEASGGDGEVALRAGRYVLAMHCRPDYTEVCHVEVSLFVA